MTSLFHIQALLAFKIDNLTKKEKQFSQQWIKEKRCECVELIREGRTINCKHYQQAFKKKYKKEREKVHEVSSFIIKIELLSNPQSSKYWLHRIKP